MQFYATKTWDTSILIMFNVQVGENISGATKIQKVVTLLRSYRR